MESDKIKPAIRSSNIFPVVGVGASAGGLNAFKKLVKAIAPNSGMAFVLVQHLDPHHESFLPEILQKITPIPVVEISNDLKIKPDHIYVIPSNKVMEATDGVLQLSPRPAKITDGILPIDLFFTSLAEVHQSRAIGVVLSGTSSDGTLGLTAIKDHGGITFAQDEQSAEYSGMPSSAAHADVVDFILPPEAIPQKLLEVVGKIELNDVRLQQVEQSREEVFKQILSLLRIRKAADFTYYKQTTVRRRILRRMVLNNASEPSAYLSIMRESNAEQDRLFEDLLIPVTSFFRDKHTFDLICSTVFPAIVKNKLPGQTCRVWVAGCSTGQEVYSIAICFKEFLGDHHEKLQIFGTDLSEKAIAKARSGIFEKGELNGVSPQRLNTFFTKNAGGYQVIKEVRDLCIFAHHNFLKDPPFGKVDFISCRNVLIYMESYLQKKAITTFHYALNPKGFLMLGKSETTGSAPGLFNAAEKTDKLYIRKDAPGHFIAVASRRSEEMLSRVSDTGNAEPVARADFQKIADDIMLKKFTPAGVVVNETLDIVHFRGSTSPYLEQLPGKPTHNLLLLAKHSLVFELRNILHKAKTEKGKILKNNIPLDINGQLHQIAIEAIPLDGTVEPHYLVLFHMSSFDMGRADVPKSRKMKKATGTLANDDNESHIHLLEKELAQARDDMRSITEDQDAFNEELQSANEELLSGSEELQTLNEELETSKEELQSTNEELTVLNHELIDLNEQVTTSRDYAEAIIATAGQPLVVLDKNLRIKSANRAFYRMFLLQEAETEKMLIYELSNRQWNFPGLRTLLDEVLPARQSVVGFEVVHEFPSIGERALEFNALEIIREKKEDKLILLSITDITDRKNAETIIKKAEEWFRSLVKALPVAVYSCDKQGLITFYNDAAVKLWGRTPEIGNDSWNSFYKIIGSDGAYQPYNISAVDELLNGRIPTAKEMIIERADGSRSIIKENPRVEVNLSGENIGVINMITDITEEITARRKIEESEKHFRFMADLMPAKVSNARINGDVIYFNKHWLDFTGMSFEQLKDSGYHKIMHPDELEEFGKRLQYAAETQTDLIMEMRFMNKHGEYIWHLNIASPVIDDRGNQAMWVGVTTDITEQINKRNSNLQAYQIHSKELEEKVQQRTAELSETNALLQQKNEELRKTNKELESFTYVSSHDLQEPLRKIQTFASIILQKETLNLSDKGKDYFKRMQEATKRMQQLILDLLSFSRVNSADRIFGKVDLGAIVDKLRTYFQEELHEKNATLETIGLCEINVIQFQFEQLFQNLISNSLKFCIPGVAPQITIRCRAATGRELNNNLMMATKYCHIIFTDNGIGFDPKYSEQIFEVFQRLHSVEEYAGTGIGLAIVKKIVENHNGLITAVSEQGRGAKFDIFIPS